MPESAAYHKQTGKDTAMILLGYPCEGIFQRQDHAAMTVLTGDPDGLRDAGRAGCTTSSAAGPGLLRAGHPE